MLRTLSLCKATTPKTVVARALPATARVSHTPSVLVRTIKTTRSTPAQVTHAASGMQGSTTFRGGYQGIARAFTTSPDGGDGDGKGCDGKDGDGKDDDGKEQTTATNELETADAEENETNESPSTVVTDAESEAERGTSDGAEQLSTGDGNGGEQDAIEEKTATIELETADFEANTTDQSESNSTADAESSAKGSIPDEPERIEKFLPDDYTPIGGARNRKVEEMQRRYNLKSVASNKVPFGENGPWDGFVVPGAWKGPPRPKPTAISTREEVLEEGDEDHPRHPNPTLGLTSQPDKQNVSKPPPEADESSDLDTDFEYDTDEDTGRRQDKVEGARELTRADLVAARAKYVSMAGGDADDMPVVQKEYAFDDEEKEAEEDRDEVDEAERHWKVYGAGKGMGADWEAGGHTDGTRAAVEGTTWEGLTRKEAAAAIAGPAPPRRPVPIKYGVVSSDKMQKTVMVKIPYTYIAPVYKIKTIRYSKIMAHDETDSLRIGDHVGISHVQQKYSKNKAHKVVEVRRKLPRLDDENALPPLEKPTAPKAVARG